MQSVTTPASAARSSGRSLWSALAFWVAAITMLWYTAFFYPRYEASTGNATLAWDAAGYYMYLPSVFIYGDLKRLDWGDTVVSRYRPGPSTAREFGIIMDNGNVVLKYSSGMAFAELPFFLLAHALAKPLGYAADGFSYPYQVGIQYGALLVSFLGLWLLRRFLRYYYSDGVVAALLLLYAIGSNYLNYSAIDGSISHTWLFTLYAALLLCTRSFYLRPRPAMALAIGVLCGWATLIRPTDVIACLVPLLWGLERLSASVVKARLAFLWHQRTSMLLAALATISVASIQAFYWKFVSGSWIVYSYGDQTFSWLHPHVVDYSFSYRSGWITYTPIMLFAIAGFLPFLRRGVNKLMVTTFLFIAFYIVTAWDIWWYAGTGGRAMIQYYPVLAIPFASMLCWIGQRSLRLWISVPLMLVFAYVNIWFTYQAHRGSLYDADGGMTNHYYWRVVGRWSAPNETLKLRDGKYLYEGPTPQSAQLIYSNSLHGVNAEGKDTMLRMSTPGQVSADFSAAFTPSGYRWIRASATFHCLEGEGNAWKMLGFLVATWKNGQRQNETMIRVQRLITTGETKRLSVDLKLPEDCDADTIKVHFWNTGTNASMEIEDLSVQAF